MDSHLTLEIITRLLDWTSHDSKGALYSEQFENFNDVHCMTEMLVIFIEYQLRTINSDYLFQTVNKTLSINNH